MNSDLHIAAGKNDTAAVLALLDRGADIEAMTDDGYTPLMCAVMIHPIITPHNDTALALIARGANVNAVTKHGWTVLMAAVSIRRGTVGRIAQADIVRVLLQHGADVNAKAKAGETAITVAARRGDCDDDILRLLAEAGADMTPITRKPT